MGIERAFRPARVLVAIFLAQAFSATAGGPDPMSNGGTRFVLEFSGSGAQVALFCQNDQKQPAVFSAHPCWSGTLAQFSRLVAHEDSAQFTPALYTPSVSDASDPAPPLVLSKKLARIPSPAADSPGLLVASFTGPSRPSEISAQNQNGPFIKVAYQSARQVQLDSAPEMAVVSDSLPPQASVQTTCTPVTEQTEAHIENVPGTEAAFPLAANEIPANDGVSGAPAATAMLLAYADIPADTPFQPAVLASGPEDLLPAENTPAAETPPIALDKSAGAMEKDENGSRYATSFWQAVLNGRDARIPAFGAQSRQAESATEPVAHSQPEPVQDIPAVPDAPAQDLLSGAKLASAEPAQLAQIGYQPAPTIKQSWVVKPGEALRQTLAEWASRAGWILTWDASTDYEPAVGTEFSGDFEEAINALFNAFPASISLRAELRVGNVPPLLVVTESRRPLQ